MGEVKKERIYEELWKQGWAYLVTSWAGAEMEFVLPKLRLYRRAGIRSAPGNGTAEAQSYSWWRYSVAITHPIRSLWLFGRSEAF